MNIIISCIIFVIGIIIAGPLSLCVHKKFTPRLTLKRCEGVVSGNVEDDGCHYVLFTYEIHGKVCNGKSGMASTSFMYRYLVGMKIEIAISPNEQLSDIPFRDYKYLPWLIFILSTIFIVSGISMIIHLHMNDH